MIDHFHNGFVSEYCRGKSMTSGLIRQEFDKAINNPLTSHAKVSKIELQACCAEFEKLIVKRNALIHAHPVTDLDGSQILAYQTAITRPLPDMKWPRTEVEAIIQEFDAAACSAGNLLCRLR